MFFCVYVRSSSILVFWVTKIFSPSTYDLIRTSRSTKNFENCLSIGKKYTAICWRFSLKRSTLLSDESKVLILPNKTLSKKIIVAQKINTQWTILSLGNQLFLVFFKPNSLGIKREIRWNNYFGYSDFGGIGKRECKLYKTYTLTRKKSG